MIKPTREEKIDALEYMAEMIKALPYHNGRLNPCQVYLLLLYKQEMAKLNEEPKTKTKRGRKPKATT
jgi:hypothetical protein